MENDTKNESAFLNDAEKIAIIGELSCIENVTALMQAKIKNGSATHEFLAEKIKELVNYTSDLEREISMEFLWKTREEDAAIKIKGLGSW